MAGRLPAPDGPPEGNANAAAPSTSGRLDVAAVQSPLTPCPSPEGRGEPVAHTRGPSPRTVQGSGRAEHLFPPLVTQVSNIFQSVVAFVGDGCGIVHDAQYRQRLEICRECDRRTGKRCTACGCWINVKARGRAFSCPLGRWQ